MRPGEEGLTQRRLLRAGMEVKDVKTKEKNRRVEDKALEIKRH